MASEASRRASPCGLPVSWCMRSASWATRRVITPFQAERCRSRSSYDSADHQAAASRARATAARTSSSVCTGCVPTTSPVVGLSESNAVRPWVRSSVWVIVSS